jgi:hypothetical protein
MKQLGSTNPTAVTKSEPLTAPDSLFGDKPKPKAAVMTKVKVAIKAAVKSTDKAVSPPKLALFAPVAKAPLLRSIP